MIKNILFGDVTRNAVTDSIIIPGPIIPNGYGLNVYPPDLSDTGNPLKLDILYYNTVNRYGEVLSTIVYISDVKASSDIEEFYFEPSRTHNNSVLERATTVTDKANNRWCNTDPLQTDVRFLKNNSRSATHPYSYFDVSADFASQTSANTYMLDGWYSLVSVAPDGLSAAGNFSAGTLRNSAGGIQYTTVNNPTATGDWEALDTIDSTVPIANLIRDNWSPYISMDFFVLILTNTVYNNLITKKLDSEWFTGLDAIRPKLRTLYDTSSEDSFIVNQFLLNSINLTLSYVSI